MLFEAVFCDKEKPPNAVFAAPVVFEVKEPLPTAVLSLPVDKRNAWYPIAVILVPLVLLNAA